MGVIEIEKGTSCVNSLATTTKPSDDMPDKLSSEQEHSLRILQKAMLFIDSLSLTSLAEPRLAGLNVRQRNLLGYFEHEMSSSVSIHAAVQHELCRVVLPMALDNPQILAAILSISSTYRVSTGLEQSEDDATQLRVVAIRQLNDSLSGADENMLLAAFATSLILSLGDIFSPTRTENWRIFLRGAIVLREHLINQPPTPELEFLRRLCLSLRLIASSDMSSIDMGKETAKIAPPGYICDLAGFSPSLGPILEQIQDFCRECDAHPTALHDRIGPLYQKYARLVEKVNMLCRLRLRAPLFRPEAARTLTADMKQDLWNLDEAFHHSALLQLHARMHSVRTPVTQAIRASVLRIIACIGCMDFTRKPNPGVSTIGPLYEAGRAAIVREDQEQVFAIILRIQKTCPVANFARLVSILPLIWRWE